MKTAISSNSFPKTLQKVDSYILIEKKTTKSNNCNYIMTVVLLNIQKTYFGDIYTSQLMFKLIHYSIGLKPYDEIYKMKPAKSLIWT